MAGQVLVHAEVVEEEAFGPAVEQVLLRDFLTGEVLGGAGRQGR